MGAGHSAEGEGGAYASDPPARNRRKTYSRRRRHSVDSVASYSSQNHVDRIRAQNFSPASCQDESDFGSIKTTLFRGSAESNKRPDSVTSNTSSTRSRFREFVERKSSQDEHKSAANTVGDIQYFENPTETLEFDNHHNSLESKKSQEERPKKKKISKNKDKDLCENKNKKREKYQSKLADYYKVPVQLPQDEFYQHLTRSKAAEELLQKRFANSDTEFSENYGRLCKHKEPEGSNLRRSRSLAVIREETFTDLQLQGHAKSKRSQLIPRARLFDKPSFKDRLIGRTKYQTKEEVLESIYIDSTASCFGDINAQKKTPEPADDKLETQDAISQNNSHHSRSIGGSWPNLNDKVKNNNLSEDSIGHSRNPSEIDSLDSNYVRKHYNFEAHRKSFKDSSPETERSLASPNPSKDLYITTDEHCSDIEDNYISENNIYKLACNKNSLTRNEKNKHELHESEPDVKAETYDALSVKSINNEVIENTDANNFISEVVTKIDDENHSVISENEEIVSSPSDSITSYISISIASSDKSHKLEHLANSLAEKIDEYCDSQFKEDISITSQTLNSENNIEDEPIYTQVNKKKTFANVRRESILNNNNKKLLNEVLNQDNEIYVSNSYIDNDNNSIKGNCTSRNITTEPYVTTLIENQYYSLPDINISKCLRKSERIDAQLRQEDPEDKSCENTYEIAQTHFHDTFSQKGNENYGKLNKLYNERERKIKIQTSNFIYLSDYSQLPPQSFNKLDDDLGSVLTIDSSTTDDKDLIYYRPDNHQNEREINEIEGTIRNNKVITKSESLRLNSIYDYNPEIKKIISLSNDNINKAVKENKLKTGIKKHYSLRQRNPTEDENDRIPSPNTVERSLVKLNEPLLVSTEKSEINKNQSLISRVQSFKTSADSNITIVPLSGHQTIVIDPPLSLNQQEKQSIIHISELEATVSLNVIPIETKKTNKVDVGEKKITTKKVTNETCVDTSNYCTPKDPFIAIKLNKIVKTTIPKFKRETCEKIAFVQEKCERPPKKLVIKDTNNIIKQYRNPLDKIDSKMTRPQVLQVVDSKNKVKGSFNTNATTDFNIKQITSTKLEDNVERIDESKEFKADHSVKDRLNNAIKTDIEYQEKLSSVKNYWSKLIEKAPECNDNIKSDIIKDEINEQDNDDNKFVSEISVGSIIKSLERAKIVDSIKKVSQSKLQLWKEETEKVRSDSEVEESVSDKILKESEEITYNKPKLNQHESEQNRDTPEIEIVELSSEDNQNKKTQATLIKAKGYEKGCNEFDHVRYKVMKSELFKNSMIANYRKEAQFDGLLQYLQDYSFQELLVNNNIVIIEPVRTKVEPTPRKNTETCKIPPTLLKKNDSNVGQVDKNKNSIRRHFFYHPIRVNKEIIEEELPNPDTVKKVRNLFEDTLKMKTPMTHDPPLIDETIGLTRRATSYRNLNEDSKSSKTSSRKKVVRQLTIDTNYGNKKWDNASLSSGVSSGDLSSNNEYETDGLSPYSQKHLKENSYCSSDEYLCDSMSQDFCCESQYVSPDILKKIRECGTSVTYYGGKVLNSKTTISPMTKAIMEEIKSLQKNCSRDCYSCQIKCRGDHCSCLVAEKHKKVENQIPPASAKISQNTEMNRQSESFPGFKFKLVKSNSCSSRLELTGTDENKNPRNKYRRQFSKEDPPLSHDNENSVKNKICRLESYNKGISKTPFENKDNEVERAINKNKIEMNKDNVSKSDVSVKLPTTPMIVETCKKEEPILPVKMQDNEETCKSSESLDQSDEPDTFEKKYYYVNDNLDQTKVSTGKFGEMVFEEFEVLESCYDSLNSNKSLK